MHLRDPYSCPISHLAIPVPWGWKVTENAPLVPGVQHTVITPETQKNQNGEYIGFTATTVPGGTRDSLSPDDKSSVRSALLMYMLQMSSQYGATMTLETLCDTQLLGDAVDAAYSRFSYRRDKANHTEALWMFHVGGQFLQLRFRCLLEQRRDYAEMLTQLHKEVKEIAQPNTKE